MIDKDEDKEPFGRNANFVDEMSEDLEDKKDYVQCHLLAAIADALERIADVLERKELK